MAKQHAIKQFGFRRIYCTCGAMRELQPEEMLPRRRAVDTMLDWYNEHVKEKKS